MQKFEPSFLMHKIYPALKIHLINLHQLDPDSIDIDFEGTNTITLQFCGDAQPDTLSIGQFQDAIIYCLALIDIDIISCTCTYDLEYTYTITITKWAN